MFIPKKSKIFDKLENQALLVKEGAEIFLNLTKDWDKNEKYCNKLGKKESLADDCVHSITDDIEKFFILPFDKEDIKDLTETIDDVIDLLEEAANRIHIYNLSSSSPSIVEFARLITKATDEIYIGTKLIKNYKMNSKSYIESYKNLHHIEGEGDKLHRKILEDLMSEKKLDKKEKTTLGVMKWKEIFEILEKVLDKSEGIAIIFERLKIKYS